MVDATEIKHAELHAPGHAVVTLHDDTQHKVDLKDWIGGSKDNEALHDDQHFKSGAFVPGLGLQWPAGLVLTCEHIAELLGGLPRV